MNFAFRKTALALLLASVSASVAFAHAILVKSTPAANEAVAGPDVVVALTFNSKVDPTRSTITLEGPNHLSSRMQVESHAPSPAEITTKISNLTAGSYKLRWQVLAVDGHITRGEIPFQVK
jgi:copper resistance protein C